jgi:hypothetical protein
VNPTIFLGLVTHQRTSYPESSGSDGLVSSVSSALTRLSVSTRVEVHDADLHDEAVVPLTNREVISSIDAELDVEQRWRLHVDPGQSHLRLHSFMATRRIYRRLRLAPPWHRRKQATPQGARMLRRLVNIELAHVNLMQAAVDCRSTWTLIVEDDARVADPQEFAEALASFVENHTSADQPLYINVSQSFADPLGISQHLHPIGAWDEATAEMAADRALTNTVCAVLYRTTFLEALLTTLREIPVSPVLPIDWKLNEALLALTDQGTISSGDCWFLTPGPIMQRSMHNSTG